MKTTKQTFLLIGLAAVLSFSGYAQKPAKTKTVPQPAPVSTPTPATKSHSVTVVITADMAAALDRLIAAQRDPATGQPFSSTDDLFQALVARNVSMTLIRIAPNPNIQAARATLKAAQESLKAKQDSADIKAAQESVKKAQSDLAAAEAAAIHK